MKRLLITLTKGLMIGAIIVLPIFVIIDRNQDITVKSATSQELQDPEEFKNEFHQILGFS